jgi:hypothetical protein
MSLANSRQEIADVLSGIDGMHGFAYRPKTTNPGDAFPLLESMDTAAGMNLEVTWRIIVLLPKTEKDAMEFFDSMHEVISDVLNEQIGYVERIQPGFLETEAGNKDVMILTVKREA